MDLIDKIKELAARIERQRQHVFTEEAVKTAFVLPLIQALGYDVFNPMEVIPELTADHGVKKGEKVDYAIKQDGKITILIECKQIGAALEAKHASQLFRYFAVTEARFGILTDGIRYVFFSDLENSNRMDERPFFEFNVLNFSEEEVKELKNFSRTAFNLDTNITTACNLKYHRALQAEIKREFENPSEDFVRLLTSRVYSGRITQQIKDQFLSLTHQALNDFVRGRVNNRLHSALRSEDADSETFKTTDSKIPHQKEESATDDVVVVGETILTTDEERNAHRIVQAICADVIAFDRITMRDAKSYCALLLDDNNRRPVCRLHFMKTRMSITLFTPEGEKRVDIQRIEEIYNFRTELRASIQEYCDPLKTNVKASNSVAKPTEAALNEASALLPA